MAICDICGVHNDGASHEVTQNHLRNNALKEYSRVKRSLYGNRHGIHISGQVKSSFAAINKCITPKIRISAKPGETVTFRLTIFNETKKDFIIVEGVQLIHSNFNFLMHNHSLQVGCQPLSLGPKANAKEDILVTFRSPNIGQYETTIVFYFRKHSISIVIVRDLVVFVEEHQMVHEKKPSPYALKDVTADVLIRGKSFRRGEDEFTVPPNYKYIFASNFKISPKTGDEVKAMVDDIQKQLSLGPVKDNYIKFFHLLLWYEETIVGKNLKKYNMSEVTLNRVGDLFILHVPGLAEKRPSLMIGDLLFIKPTTENIMFEACIKEVNESEAIIYGFNRQLFLYSDNGAKFDIRFFACRVPLVRMHQAVNSLFESGQESRVVPKENAKLKFFKPSLEFYNSKVESNPEQRRAVEHILAGTAGTAPYLLHGPPGTGKTVTVVEAILQVVNKNANNRVLVCTDSNMAADHVATMLIKYTHLFSHKKLILRANSQFRVWETLPECLVPYSNGSSKQNFYPIDIEDFMSYHIVITTLSHAAKFGSDVQRKSKSRHITHLFIDEAAQASEPSCLIPVCGLLAAGGLLVLAGDPHQLGPVVISHDAAEKGLGISLMERLKKDPLYNDTSNDPNYMVMLRNNFRSNPDILDIPDKLFYGGQLRALAELDKLSNIDILGEKMTSRAVVFHGVLSKEQKMGKSPSFFNSMEAETVKMYVKCLVTKHNLPQEDIGIVTPYIRQVYHIKSILREMNCGRIEVGTVEAFQGKEKRVIIISTVRANNKLISFDAKFQLGFLVDKKRFNVAITRAKAKVIVIGNPLCLKIDKKWEQYMQKCRELGTYHGFDYQTIKTDDYTTEILDKVKNLLKELSIDEQAQKKNVPKKK